MICSRVGIKDSCNRELHTESNGTSQIAPHGAFEVLYRSGKCLAYLQKAFDLIFQRAGNEEWSALQRVAQ